MIEGLRYAFPQAAAAALDSTPAIVELHGRVAAHPHVAADLRSPRRIAFNEDGFFRRDAEPDVA